MSAARTVAIVLAIAMTAALPLAVPPAASAPDDGRSFLTVTTETGEGGVRTADVALDSSHPRGARFSFPGGRIDLSSYNPDLERFVVGPGNIDTDNLVVDYDDSEQLALNCFATFFIDQIEFDGDQIVRFAARFGGSCYEYDPPEPYHRKWAGAIAYRATVPVAAVSVASGGATNFGTFGDADFVTTRRVEIANDGSGPLVTHEPSLAGPGADQFRIASTTCHDGVLAPGQTCAIEVSAEPTHFGRHDAFVVFDPDGYAWERGVPVALRLSMLTGDGRPPPLAGAKVHPVTPVRVLDTRAALGRAGTEPVGVSSITLAIAGVGGVPDSAIGVIANVTVTEPTARGFLSVYPTGQPRPVVSNQNFVPGDTVATLSTLALGSNGAIDIFNSAGQTHVIVDVVAWLGDDIVVPTRPAVPNGMVVDLLSKARRVFDTRQNPFPTDPGGTVGPGETLVLHVGPAAMLLNVTATQPTADTYLAAHAAGAVRPNVSSLNVRAGETRPNLVFVEADSNGNIAIYNHVGRTHIVVDLVMSFATVHRTNDFGPPTYNTGGTIILLSPFRAYDSRNFADGAFVPYEASYIDLDETIDGLPVVGLIMNATVTEPTAAGYFAVSDLDTVTTGVSTLNFVRGQTVPNGAWIRGNDVGLGNGSLGRTHIIIDVQAVIVTG
jgi:hypothetical protein